MLSQKSCWGALTIRDVSGIIRVCWNVSWLLKHKDLGEMDIHIMRCSASPNTAIASANTSFEWQLMEKTYLFQFEWCPKYQVVLLVSMRCFMLCC